MAVGNEIEIVVSVDDRASAKITQIATMAGAAADRINDSLVESIGRLGDTIDTTLERTKGRFDELGKHLDGSLSHAARRFGDSMGDAGKRVSDGFGERATEGIGRLGDTLADVGQEAGMFGLKMASTAASTALAGAGATAATGGMNLLVGALLAVAAAVAAAVVGMFALAPAISLVGGLAAGAIGILFGLGSAIATLGVGLGGVSDAWGAYGKSAGGGGGASKAAGEQAYQAARRIEQAEDAVTRAKRAAVKASQDVTRAREEERERIEDLTLALRGQQYAQQDAADELKAAEDKLAREKVYGNSHSVSAAQAEVDRARYRYDYETERLKDLEADKAKADKAGVEGSDQVKSALERERDAAEAVTDAMESLADAKRKVETASGGAGGGIDQFAEAMSKLSPNAQSFVRTLIRLKEGFADVKRQVQDRLFAGLDKSLEQLAANWGPKLVPILGGMADALNRVAKAIGEALGDEDFINNVQKASKAFEGFLDYLGEAAADIIDAFGRIAGASGPILETLGWIIADIADSFADWIEQAEKTGGLESFMETAARYLREIYDIGKIVFSIMGEIIEILFPSSDTAATGLLAGVKEALSDVEEWLGDPKNKQSIRDFFAKFDEFFTKLTEEWIPDLQDFARNVGALVGPFNSVIKKFKEVKGWLENGLPGAFGRLATKGKNIFDGVKEGFRAGINWIIGKWNSLEFSLPSISVFGQQIGGQSFGTPNLDYFASGGVSSGRPAIMNERGAEAVRLPTGSMVYSAGDSARMMGGGRQGVDLNVKIDRTTERGLVDVLFGMLRFEIDQRFGGDVQLALGTSR
jgi:hypothetical protein